MSFPTVQTRSSAKNDAGGTSHSITMPSGITAGDLLVITFTSDGSPTCSISSGGWLKLGQMSNGTAVTGAVFAKIAAGSDTATVTTSVTESTSHVVHRISSGGGSRFWINGVAANGNSTNSNPPNHFAGGQPATGQDFLWLVTRSGDATVVATAAPSNYDNLQTIAGVGTGSASTNTAERTLNAVSEDPGTFTSNAENWVSWTLAIGPINEPSPVFFDSGSSVTTHQFKPEDNSLLVALVAGTDGGLCTVSDSLSGSWTRKARAEATDQNSRGQAEIWIRDVATAEDMTITVANSSTASTSMRVRNLTGFGNVSQQTATAATSSASTTTSQAITTTQANSLPVAVASYWTATIAATSESGTLKSFHYDASNSATGLHGEKTALTSSPGSTTVGWTNTGLSATVGKAAFELLPPPSGVATHRFFSFF